MSSIVCVQRLFVSDSTISQFSLHLERTQDRVWLSKKESCLRYTMRGVPAMQGEVCITERVRSDLRIVAEVCRKAGKFDGKERLVITLRNWSNYQRTYQDATNQPQPIPEGTISIHPGSGYVVVMADWTGGNWSHRFETLRSDLSGYSDLGAIVLWHWARYYNHLGFEDAKSMADTFEVLFPEARATMTLAEVNRLASRELYALSRQLGWRKLTLRERNAYALDKPWVRQEDIAKRREEMGYSTTGCGQYTHEAANGQQMHTVDVDEEILTAYGVVATE